MERSVILADFQACTGLTDMEYCISVLESHNWDLTAAVASTLADGLPDTTTFDYNPMNPNTTPFTVDQQQQLNDQSQQTGGSVSSQIPNTVEFGNNPMGPVNWNSTTSQSSAVSSQSVVERDAGPVLSSGSVRQLHFQIHLDLPPTDEDSPDGMNACEESFIYPETETVGSLKRHFINLRLTELISLATLPEWTVVIPELTPQSLLAHLSFESSSATNLNDNSAVLRSLHLPKFNSIRASLMKEAVQNALPQPTTCSEAIEIRVYVNLNSGASGPVEFRSYSVCVQPEWRAHQVRREASNVTGIATPRQLWVEHTRKRRGTSDNGVLHRLIRELNRRRAGAAANGCAVETCNSPTMREIGLQPGSVYKIQLTESTKGRHSQPPSSTPVVEVDSSRKPTSASSTRAAEDDAESDEGDQEDMDLDDDLMDGLDSTQPSVWSTPLIPETAEGDDPAEATEQFCALFIQRYCTDGQAVIPPFATGSLDSALACSVFTSSVSDRKPLFIYLHNDQSVACHVFCQQILCSVELGQFFGENDCSIWPWDVTRTRAKERLFGWLESKVPNLVGVIASLSVDSYPVLAMIGKVSGQLEVFCVVLGTGAVSGLLTTAPLESDFPSLDSSPTVRHVLKPFPDNTSGSLKPDVILAELWQAFTTYQELLAPERAAEVERIARQQVRIEQERAFQESLRLDRLKAENAEREREKQAQLEQEKLRAQTEASKRRLQMAATLPSEPPAPNTPAAEAFMATTRGSAGIASLRFRLPQDSPSSPKTNDSMVLRRFAGSDKLKDVFAFVESKGFPVSEYKLLTTFPRRDLSALDGSSSLSDLGLVPQETLILESR